MRDAWQSTTACGRASRRDDDRSRRTRGPLDVTAVAAAAPGPVTLRFRSVDASWPGVVARWIGSADECVAWAGPGVGFPMTAQSVARDILEPDASEYGLFDGDRIVAFGQLICRSTGRAHLARLIVHPRRRGEGLGALLVDRLVAEARGRAVSIVSLNVNPSNLPAVSIYTRAGFTESLSPRRADSVVAMELALGVDEPAAIRKTRR